MSFLKLYTPTKPEDEKKYWSYQNTPFPDLFKNNNEKELYSTSKIVRTKNELPKPKFNPNDFKTYGDLVINKPKLNSPAGALFNTSGGGAQSEGSIQTNKGYDVKGASKQALGTFLGGTKIIDEPLKKATLKYGEKALSGVGVGLDVMNEPINKMIVNKANQSQVPFFNMKDVLTKISDEGFASGVMKAIDITKSNIVDKSSNLSTALGNVDVSKVDTSKDADLSKRKSDAKAKTEYLFGTKSEWGDLLNFNTANEKRKIIANDNPNLKNDFAELDKFTTYIDVLSGVATGVGASKTLGKLAIATGTTTITGKAINAISKVVDPSLSNMAKLGVATAGISALNYEATGKFLFEDESAMQGQLVALTSLGLKGLVDTPSAIKALRNNPEFQKGYQKVAEEIGNYTSDKVDKYAEFVGAKMNVVENSSPIDFSKKGASKEVNNIIQELNLSQTGKGKGLSDFEIADLNAGGIDFYDLPTKVEKIQKLREAGILKYAGEDEKGLSFIWTGLAQKDNRIRINGKGFHIPVDDFNKITGEKLGIKNESNIKLSIEEEAKNKVKDAEIRKSQIKSQEIPDQKPRATKLGYDQNGNFITNKASYIYERGLSKVVQRQWRTMGRLLGDSRANLFTGKKIAKEAEKTLKSAQEFGKADVIFTSLNNIQKELGDNIPEFNVYLSNKSRWQKSINFKKAGKELVTVIDVNGQKVKLGISDLERGWTDLEGKYAGYAKRIYKLNSDVLDMEVDAGILSRNQADKFIKENPYYVPDRLKAEREGNIAKSGGVGLPKSRYIKSLKGGSETREFNNDAIDNFGKQIGGRIQDAVNSKTTNLLHDIAERNGITDIARVVKPGEALRDGYTTMTSYIDGKSRLVEVPIFWKEFVDNNDKMGLNTFLNYMSVPTSILKMQATGIFAPVFTAKSIVYETLAGLRKTWVNGGSVIDYGKSYIKIGSIESKSMESKIAIRALMKHFGGDFSHSKFIQKEFDNYDILSGIKERSKAGKLVHKANEIGHKVELNTTRLPTFEAMIRKSGISRDEFDAVAKKYVSFDGDEVTFKGGSTSVQKMIDELTSKGVNLIDAGDATRGLFDYSIASNGIKKIGRFIPYLNTAVTNVTATKTMIEESPRKAMAYYSAIMGMAYTMYEYNYSGSRGDTTRRQNPYIRTKVGFIDYDEEAGKTYINDILGNNIQELEWIYPMVVDMLENGNVGKEGFNRMFKDMTYFGDMTKPLGIDISKLGPVPKSIVELYFNKDLFYDKDLVSNDLADNTKEFDRYTNPLVVKMSNILALTTGGEIDSSGIIKGGVNLSPKRLEKYLEMVDPLGTFIDTTAVLVNSVTDIGVTDSNVKRFRSLGAKVYNTTYGDIQSGEGAKYTKDDYKSTYKTILQSKFNEAKTIPELQASIDKTRAEYVGHPEFEMITDVAKDVIKDRKVQINYGMNYFYESKRTAKEYAEMLVNLSRNEGVDKVKEKINLVRSRGTFDDAKIKEINKYYLEILAQ